jgi:beta-1,4-mannosyl-glycoprotein beta-1,4-N-acetylglucosaminyltransferase
MTKYSIVIPTYNHLEDCLKPCVESIIKFTDLSNVEVIIVANGCVDGTKDYLKTLPTDYFKTIWLDAPSGYTHSTNEGIKIAKGEYVILLNNDTVLLPQNVNDWLKMLEAPFVSDEKVGATGPMLNFCPHSERNFLIFFCVMIKKTMFERFGLLDEIFNPGFGEDTDFSIRLQEAGLKCIQVPYQDPLVADQNQERMTGGFPIFHFGEKTLGTIQGGDELLNRNRKILEDRWKGKKASYEVIPQMHILNLEEYKKAQEADRVAKEAKQKDPLAHLMKLNLGCGDTLLDGYVNADLYNPAAHVKADAYSLPFPNERFEELFACHIFEHLSPYKIADTLIEWKRVLKPGGKLIMEMPDILEICKNFEKCDKGERYRLLNCIFGTTQIEHPHLFGWYPEILNDHLIYAGFENILFMPAKVYHWGFNLRVECQKSTGEANKPKESPELDKLVQESTVIHLDAILPELPNKNLPDGFFSIEDIEIYRNLISALPDNAKIAELGVWQGRSLCSIADLIKKKNLQVCAVDIFSGTDNCMESFLAEEAKKVDIRQVFENNLKAFGIHENVQVLQMTTTVASGFFEKNTFDFIFIDADHRYECVKEDIYNWMPLVKKGCSIAGHDIMWNTVATAVNEIFPAGSVYAVANVWWSTKLEKSGKVYDCFTFFNELDVLEIRLNELDSVVDKFIIVEASTTHTNIEKPFYFEENKERFAKFLHKIRHIKVVLPKDGDTWVKERAQRDFIDIGIKEMCVPGDIIMISDADEIPKMETVRDYRVEHGPKQFMQQLYYYSLNNKCVNDNLWNWGKILPYEVYKNNNMTPCQVRYTPAPELIKGGWHFSFIGNLEFIKKKISSWAHAEFNTPEINNDNNINNSIRDGKDVFGRYLKFEKVPIDESYPKFIQNNKDALVKKELIRE